MSTLKLFAMELKSILNTIVKKSSWYKEVQFKDCEKFWRRIPANLFVVNLGSNSGKFAFNYDGLDICAQNWAMGPQPLIFDLGILTYYGKHIRKGGYLFLPLCPFSSLVGYNVYVPGKYYTLLPNEYIPFSTDKGREEVLDVKDNPYKYYPLLYSYVDLKRWVRSVAGQFHTAMEMSQDLLAADAEKRVTSWKKEFKIDDLEDELSGQNRKSWNESAEILSRIIKEALLLQLHPVLVIPPVTPQLSVKLSEKMRQRYLFSYIRKANTAEVPFFNYMDDPEFSDGTLFQNSFFLNEKGAKRFTRRLLNDLKLIE